MKTPSKYHSLPKNKYYSAIAINNMKKKRKQAQN